MPTGRKYTKRGARGMRRYKNTQHHSASVIQSMVRRAINKNIETKQGLNTPTDGLEISHNDFVVISSNPLATQNGVTDTKASMGTRIGDEINLKGMSLKFMVELNERYSDVTYKLFIVKSAKGDTPTSSTLFNGISGNKMIDTFNRERFTKIHSETFKIKAPNASTFASRYSVGGSDSGVNYRNDPQEQLSRATKIVKVWVDGKKFVKGGLVQYENSSQQVKFFDYHILLYAYSNFSTSSAGGWYVGRLNDAVIQLYYKDA